MEDMERLEIFITVLLLLLVGLGVYIATSWTLSRKKRQEEGDRKDVMYKQLEEEEEKTRKRVATEYAQETMPKITITPVQPRPDFPRGLLPSDDTVTTEDDDDDDDDDSQSDDHPDLGRLYFALRYDQHRGVLIVRLIRAEDIPSDREVSGTYVDVHLLPLNQQSQRVEPYETTINVCFREVYEFPLTQSNMALQTLNLHICRYDNFSRKTSVGDVFLALAELSAQGIDFTREVFLCRNIISHQEIYRTLGRRKRNRPAEEEEEREEGRQGQQPNRREGKFSKKSTKRMWDLLRQAVWTGAYKKHAASETAMYWESIFSSGRSSVEGYRFNQPVGISGKSPTLSHFSGPGPGESHKEANEDVFQSATWERSLRSQFHFPPLPEGESEIESSANEKEDDDEPEKSSGSSPLSPVQLSPAPEEYYRIVPITPFAPVASYKDRGGASEPTVSWQLPQTYTSREHDVVQSLSQAYKEPRNIPPSSFAFESRLPASEKGSASREPKDYGKEKEQPSFSKGQRKKRRGGQKAFSPRQTRKLSPRKEPDGEPAEGKFKTRVMPVLRVRGEESEMAEEVSIKRHSTESLEEDPLVMTPSRLPASSPERFSYSSASTEDYRTPLTSPLKEFYKLTRAQSDPDFNVEHARSVAEARSGLRLATSMLEMRESEQSDE